MSYDYSENILVQDSAGNLLRDELGWDVKFAYNTEVLGDNGTFGRKSYKEILLVRYFRAALKKLNPWISDEQILEAQGVLERRLSTSSPIQINEEKYFLIRDGIPVTVKQPDGKTETKRATVIDFQHPENNYFLAIKELKIHGELYRRRTDIVGFVNGLPLLFVELKRQPLMFRTHTMITIPITEILSRICFITTHFLCFQMASKQRSERWTVSMNSSMNGNALTRKSKAA